MSSVAIITSIIVLLAGLVCYAFISQTMSQKRQQRERLLMALKSRVRNFKFMLNGFPTGFLPKELTLLVQRSLLQLLEQLVKLEPGNGTHKEDLQVITQQIAEAQRQPPQRHQPVTVDNPQKTREIKTSLEELYKFIFHLEGKKNLTKAQADVHRGMIRHLVLQLAVDTYAAHGRIAREKGKLRLAIHYFDLAQKLMTKERTAGNFDARIAQMRASIHDLEDRLHNETNEAAEVAKDEGDQTTVNSEWDKFTQENWKKKQIYD